MPLFPLAEWHTSSAARSDVRPMQTSADSRLQCLHGDQARDAAGVQLQTRLLHIKPPAPMWGGEGASAMGIRRRSDLRRPANPTEVSWKNNCQPYTCPENTTGGVQSWYIGNGGPYVNQVASPPLPKRPPRGCLLAEDKQRGGRVPSEIGSKYHNNPT